LPWRSAARCSGLLGIVADLDALLLLTYTGMC